MNFVYYNNNPCKNHTGDCVYRALAYFMNELWKTAVMRLVRCAIVDGFVNFNYTSNIKKFMKRWNFECYKAPRKGITVREFGDEFAKRNEVYMIHVVKPKHMTIIDGGDLMDIWDCRDCVMDWYFKKEKQV